MLSPRKGKISSCGWPPPGRARGGRVYFFKLRQPAVDPTCGDPAQLQKRWRASSQATSLPVEMGPA